MDWGTTGITVAIFAIQIVLYFWQEPKIGDLEKKRSTLIENVVDELLSTNKEGNLKGRLMTYLLEVFEKDKDLIMPIRQLTPYRKTTAWLGVALVTSIVTGFFHRVLSASSTGLVIAGEDITFSHLVGISLFFIWWYVAQKLY